MITKEKNRLIIQDGFGTVWIESWGKNSVRVRMTNGRFMDKNDWALDATLPSFLEWKKNYENHEDVDSFDLSKTCVAGAKLSADLEESPSILIEEIDTTYPWSKHFDNVEETSGQIAFLRNGNLEVQVNHENWISFWQILDEEAVQEDLNDCDENCEKNCGENCEENCGENCEELRGGESGILVGAPKNCEVAVHLHHGKKRKLLFEEQWRNRWRIDRFCVPTNNPARELKNNDGKFNCRATVRFEAYDDEKFFGMGQYQDSHLDKKGGVWELSQKNSQASVPFVISSRGYGFLWNNPAVGMASFGTNGTIWQADETQKIDYWVTCGNPTEIEENYTAVTGRTPLMPEFAMGFWQCKLRYQNQDEVLQVAHEYRKRGLPLDVIVIDFFHWTCQGDFKFDPEDWPDPEKMVMELGELGVKLMVSVWPTVDERSENFDEMAQNGLLISFDKKDGFNMDWMGNTVFFDTTNPKTREFVWEKCKENYFKKGIQLFWLDEAEPEYGIYEFEHYKYHIGPAKECSNIYPYFYAKGFYDGLKAEGVEYPLSLVRCAWAGSQKFGAVVWSGDVHSDFRSFRNQVQAGLSMAIAGIPWWTTDIGGFLGGDIRDDDFKELLIRWFEWGVFCPVMRLHGERPPFKVLEKPFHEVRDHQIKQMESGQNNEIWSFGNDVYEILENLLHLRARLKPYIKIQMENAHKKGHPVMRPLMFDFPYDENAWQIEDQYMFGDKILVNPVMQKGSVSRTVYLPHLKNGEKWTNAADGMQYEGGRVVTVKTPLCQIPIFTRGDFQNEFGIKIW